MSSSRGLFYVFDPIIQVNACSTLCQGQPTMSCQVAGTPQNNVNPLIKAKPKRGCRNLTLSDLDSRNIKLTSQCKTHLSCCTDSDEMTRWVLHSYQHCCTGSCIGVISVGTESYWRRFHPGDDNQILRFELNSIPK